MGGRRVYFGWNLKHEALCGCLNTLWHVVWEERWARGGAELCGCRKQSSPAAGNSFGSTPLGKYLTAEKPRPVLRPCTVKTEFGPSVGSILPFFMWAGRSGKRCPKFSALRPTQSKANWGCDWTPCCWRGCTWAFSLALEGLFSFLLIMLSSWRAAAGTGDPVYCSFLTQGRRLHVLPLGPLNHSAQMRD